MIENLLKELGFNEKEIAVYLEAIKLGRTTPARIAKNTGINRATVYSVIKNLVKKGVLAEDLGGKYEYIVALPPESLENIITKKKSELKKEAELISQAVDELEKLPSGIQYSLPKIRFVEELNIESFFYKQILAWNKSLKETDSAWWGFQDHSFVEHYEKSVKDYWKHESTEGIYLKLLTNPSKAEEKMSEMNEPRRKIRYWGEKLNFTSTLWIVGNYVIIIYTRERPFYLIEIYNPELAHNLREVFKGIWEKLDNN